MLLVIGGIKGGSGKTTLATNLCQIRAESGRKVLLVDADEQKSCIDWAAQRKESNVPTSFKTIALAGKDIHLDLERLKKDYDDIIVDAGGRDTTTQRSALYIADVYLIPFRPRSLDLWTIEQVQAILKKCTNKNLKTFVVVNQADATGTDNIDTLNLLKECPEFTCANKFIVSRKSFANASTKGLSVSELSPRDEKASVEVMELCNEIYAGYM